MKSKKRIKGSLASIERPIKKREKVHNTNIDDSNKDTVLTNKSSCKVKLYESLQLDINNCEPFPLQLISGYLVENTSNFNLLNSVKVTASETISLKNLMLIVMFKSKNHVQLCNSYIRLQVPKVEKVCSLSSCSWMIELDSVKSVLETMCYWNTSMSPNEYRKECLRYLNIDANVDNTIFITCQSASQQLMKAVQAKCQSDYGVSSARLKLSNVSETITERQLYNLLKPFGLIRKFRFRISKVLSSKPDASRTRYAFVYYKEYSAAEEAMRQLHGKVLCGKRIHMEWCFPKQIKAIMEDSVSLIEKIRRV